MRRAMRENAGRRRAGGKRWKAVYDPKLERQRLGLGKAMSERVGSAIDGLLAPENVRDPRDGKGRIRVDGAPTQVFACSASRSYRILYCVNDDSIRFPRVGDRKAVYGRG